MQFDIGLAVRSDTRQSLQLKFIDRQILFESLFDLADKLFWFSEMKEFFLLSEKLRSLISMMKKILKYFTRLSQLSLIVYENFQVFIVFNVFYVPNTRTFACNYSMHHTIY